MNISKRILSGALAFTLTIVGLALSEAPGATEAVAVGSAGFSPGAGILWESDADLARDLDTMAATGATWVRIDFPWSVLEPNNGSFSWSITDRAVDAARARGLQVLAVAAYTPAWARPPGTDSDKFPPTDPQAYARFLTAAVGRYSTRVKVWEIWNEPNITPFWRAMPDVTAYVALLKAAYPAIKAVDPLATVVSGGLSPAVDAADGSQISPPTFVSRMYQAGAKGSFDAVGVHPYSFPARPMDPTTSSWNTFYRLPMVHDAMVLQGDGSKKIWLTEFGAPTGTHPSAVSEPEQSAILSDALNAIGQWPWAGPLLWYAGRDAGTLVSDREQNFGLLRRDFSPKPAMETLRLALGGPTATTTTVAPTTTTTVGPTTTTTVAPTTTLTVSSVRASQIKKSSAVITWTSSVPATSEVVYGKPVPNTTVVGAPGMTSHTVTLANLMPSTRYAYKVQSRTSTGALAVSTVYYFTTL